MKVSVIIAAGGKGSRMGYKENKVFMNLCGKEIILHTIEAFEKNSDVDEIIVVTGQDEHMRVAEIAKGISKMHAVTTGGKTRQESVYNGLGFSTGDIILIHDGARALIGQEEISKTINAAKEYGAAAVGVPCKDTLKSADKDRFITGTIDRDKTFLIQTPQAFKRDIIFNAHNKALENGIDATDDCALVEMCGGRIKIVTGQYDNIKLTTPEDIEVAEKILEKRSMRI